ncbi:MAG: hypothetical protein NVS4B12_27750 [Ktedonobacteraceae bacterium]
MATRQRVSLAQRMRRLRRAEQSKWNKYTWSGLLIILAGLVLIFVGIGMRTGAYSSEGLAIGFGALIVLAGIIRTLIGVINPSSPEELIPYEMQEQREAERLEEVRHEDPLFERESE